MAPKVSEPCEPCCSAVENFVSISERPKTHLLFVARQSKALPLQSGG
jgi:hypothetical protein